MVTKINCPNIFIQDILKSSGLCKIRDQEDGFPNSHDGLHVNTCNEKIQEIVDRYNEGRISQYRQPYRETGFPDQRDGPIHLRYSCLFARYKTIVDWTEISHIICKTIAKAGYFFCRQSRNFICFFCGLQVVAFRTVENILIEHTIYSPHCGFIEREMGQYFIYVVQESFRADIPVRAVLKHLPELDHLLSATETKIEKDISETTQALIDEHKKATTCSICSKD
ncbi:hypothetical protein Btru_052709 [Bulinus truncatus]|nr:hypothetical protein Btru_052709 [Bulinus truncatus]